MTNEVLEIIKKRRSVRSYKQEAVPEELLDAVLEAGTFAPTGMNKQSPVIISVTSENTARSFQGSMRRFWAKKPTRITAHRRLFLFWQIRRSAPLLRTQAAFWKI